LNPRGHGCNRNPKRERGRASVTLRPRLRFGFRSLRQQPTTNLISHK
jgi:hypothetical protein